MPDVTLVSEHGDRLASPLILRPLACAEGKAVGLAARLNAPMAQEYQLTGAVDSPVSGKPTQKQANDIQPLNGETDVLTAFLNYLNRK